MGRTIQHGRLLMTHFEFTVSEILDGHKDMGEGARRRLQLLAANFEQKLSNIKQPSNGVSPHSGPALQEAGGAAAERRGLLDDDDGEDMIEFETRKKSD